MGGGSHLSGMLPMQRSKTTAASSGLRYNANAFKPRNPKLTRGVTDAPRNRFDKSDGSIRPQQKAWGKKNGPPPGLGFGKLQRHHSEGSGFAARVEVPSPNDNTVDV